MGEIVTRSVETVNQDLFVTMILESVLKDVRGTGMVPDVMVKNNNRDIIRQLD